MHQRRISFLLLQQMQSYRGQNISGSMGSGHGVWTQSGLGLDPSFTIYRLHDFGQISNLS